MAGINPLVYAADRRRMLDAAGQAGYTASGRMAVPPLHPRLCSHNSCRIPGRDCCQPDFSYGGLGLLRSAGEYCRADLSFIFDFMVFFMLSGFRPSEKNAGTKNHPQVTTETKSEEFVLYQIIGCIEIVHVFDLLLAKSIQIEYNGPKKRFRMLKVSPAK